MPTNDFKAFATGSVANVTTQAQWVASPELQTGFTSGKAPSAKVNKAIRQSSFIATALAQFVSDKSGQDTLDDGDVSGFTNKLISAFAAQYPGRLVKITKFTSSGTYTKSSGVRTIKVRAVSAGGGGGGTPACASGQQSTAASGESGSYIEAIIDVTAVTTLPVVIGAKGLGAAAGTNTGGAGGATTLGSVITCPGGNGGGGGTASAVVPAVFRDSTFSSTTPPSSTGTVLNSVIARAGAFRVAVSTTSVLGGTGGSSIFGAGGFPGVSDPGKNGQGNGTGGGGASTTSGGTANNGGDGTDGLMIIEEYA